MCLQEQRLNEEVTKPNLLPRAGTRNNQALVVSLPLSAGKNQFKNGLKVILSMDNVFAASFESEYCSLLQSLSTSHLPLLPLVLSSCATLHLGKGKIFAPAQNKERGKEKKLW